MPSQVRCWQEHLSYPRPGRAPALYVIGFHNSWSLGAVISSLLQMGSLGTGRLSNSPEATC